MGGAAAVLLQFAVLGLIMHLVNWSKDDNCPTRATLEDFKQREGSVVAAVVTK
jgi:hypothetical protein